MPLFRGAVALTGEALALVVGTGPRTLSARPPRRWRTRRLRPFSAICIRSAC
jgi:hypothetical protein